MRRFISALLAIVLCLGLNACSKTPEPEETTAATTTAPTTEPTTAPTEPTTEPTEPPVLYRNPLNGEPIDAPWTGRATTYVINNLKQCLPQHGVGDADFIYELETEGGITRMLAVFSNDTDVPKIGPVRSARSFFNNITESYGGTIVHCGGSLFGREGWYDDTGAKIPNWTHIDARFYSTTKLYAGQTGEGYSFFRDMDRYNSGYNWEHCLFTSGNRMDKLLEDKGITTTIAEGVDYGLQFADKVSLKGDDAKEVVVTFRANKTTTMTYNAETGLYEAAQYGEDYIDGNSGETLTFRNVFVLYTDHWFKNDPNYTRSMYDLIGSGEGHFACDGKIVPIKWVRENLSDPFSYTLEDGTPITLGVGKSYVGITKIGKTVSYS